MEHTATVSTTVRAKVGDWNFHLYPGSSKVGVVLVHEIFGFDEYIESVARALSREQVWTAAVDLYRGKYASDLEEGLRIRSSLKDSEVLDALHSGILVLREKIGEEAKIGSMGFCMGGGFALLGACNLDMSFCVDYYGLIDDTEQTKALRGPIQIILASEDEWVTPWAYQKFLPAATEYKKRVDLHLYPQVQHGFHRPDWEGHDPSAAEDAWSKSVRFLAQFKQKVNYT